MPDPDAVADETAYSHFRFSMHSNGRGTYHHFAGIHIGTRA